MDEARRFLRYVTPGLVFFVETLLLIWVLLPDWLERQLVLIKDDVGIGFALAAVLGSGGLGLLFSAAHHSLHWRLVRGTVNHRAFISRLRSTGTLILIDGGTRERVTDAYRPNRFEAWSITTALWHERVGRSKMIKGAEPRAASLFDLVHSMGAGRVASLAAVLMALATAARVADLSLEREPVLRFIAACAVWSGMFWLHHDGYRHTSLVAQQVVEEILHDALIHERSLGEEGPQVPTTYVTFTPEYGSNCGTAAQPAVAADAPLARR